MATRLRIRVGALETPSGPATFSFVSEAAEHEVISLKHLVVCHLVLSVSICIEITAAGSSSNWDYAEVPRIMA